MRRVFTLVGLAGAAMAAPLAAQYSSPAWFVEARVGAMVPTFDIADDIKTGSAFGGTIGYRIGSRLSLLGELDYGKHDDKETETVEVTTTHFMAKVGYALMEPRERGLGVSLNLGAGAVKFDVDGGSSYTYPAINAGAKITYGFTRSIALVLSPQGDIIFGKEEEIGTSNAWVWPVTAGLRFTF